MIQTVEIPELPLTTDSIKKSMTTDFFSMWNVYSKSKRLENRNWRLWHHESFQHHEQQDIRPTSVKVHPITTTVPSSVLIISSLSSHSTFGPHTPLGNHVSSDLLCHHHVSHPSAESSRQQQRKRRTNKFYVDESDESDQEDKEEDDTFEHSESLWSTVHDDHYLEEAYQRNQVQPVLSPPPRKENPAIHAAPLDLAPPPPSATNQKQPCSLLSRLLQSAPQPPPSNLNDHQHNAYDVLPPQLQSCVDWEKTQNSIRYRLGYALDLPNENIIW